jgi:hypothetical protein
LDGFAVPALLFVELVETQGKLLGEEKFCPSIIIIFTLRYRKKGRKEGSHE